MNVDATRKGPMRAGDRPDLSPYIVHLTRNYGAAARDNLVSIVSNKVIEARTAYGIAVAHLDYMGWHDPALKESQKVACFSETPLASIGGLLDPGIWRRYDFQPYGVVFRRSHMLYRGANMVMYLNQYRGDGFRWPVHDFNELIDAAVLAEDGKPDVDQWNASAIARLTPHIESIGEWPSQYGGTKTKEFSFEREWRFVGDFHFLLQNVYGLVVRTSETNLIRDKLAGAGVAKQHLDRIRFIEISSLASAVA